MELLFERFCAVYHLLRVSRLKVQILARALGQRVEVNGWFLFDLMHLVGQKVNQLLAARALQHVVLQILGR